MVNISSLRTHWIAEAARWRSVPPSAFEALPFIDPQNPIPFEHTFAPFILVAMQRLEEKLGPHTVFSEVALAQLARGLSTQIADLCGGTLLLAFNIARSVPGTPAQRDRLAAYPTGSQFYWDFVYSLLNERWIRLWEEYPYLLGQMASVIQNWIDNIWELSQRLIFDWTSICKIMPLAPQLHIVQTIEPNLSDRHQGHRSVHILHFGQGFQLVYKPRSVSMEAAFYRFVSTLNDQGAGIDLATPYIVERSGYGWMERVEPADCDSHRAVNRYYKRIGQLLCLLYVLGGTDIHAGNLIASGEHPVLIDLETLFHPQLWTHQVNQSETLAEKHFWDSVIRTGLLPLRRVLGTEFDVSALGMRPGMRLPSPRWKWLSINNDGMRRLREISLVEQSTHCAKLKGQVTQPEAYTHVIIDGFQTYYRWIKMHKQDCEAGLQAFVGLRPRLLQRNTWEYAEIIQKLNQPNHLRYPNSDQLADLSKLERAAIENREIPLLYGEELSQNDVRYYLDRMHSNKLITQKALIQICHNTFPHSPTSENSSLLKSNGNGIEAARHMYERIKFTGVSTGNELHWIGLEHLPSTRQTVIQPLAYNLNSGQIGVAFFLAALYAITGEVHYRTRAQATIRPLQRLITSEGFELEQLETRMSIGCVAGIGSLLYGLQQIGRLLKDKSIETAAHQIAKILIKRLPTNTELDVMNGLAGAILALLSYHEMTGEPKVLQLLVSSSEPLLEVRFSQTGFAHGAAGAAYALLCLGQRTGNQQLVSIACRQMLQIPHTSSDLSWCNGATGTGLAFLEGYKQTQCPELRQRAEWCLTAVHQQQIEGPQLDTLCCGFAGHMELFHSAIAAGWQEYEISAQQKKAELLERIQKLQVVYHKGANEIGLCNPGLFHGYAGIGYQLLRMERPNQLPSILRFATQ